MIWVKDTGKYASGSLLKLGRWMVGAASYDASRSKGEQNKWLATCNLPGMKSSLGHFENEELAKSATEAAVKHWLKGAALSPKEDG